MASPSEPPTLSIVIPVYSEGPNLDRLLAELERQLVAIGESYELVFVDDGSTDDTWQVLTAARPRYPHLRALRLSRNFGKEAALCAGLEAARGQAIIVMDADLQHPPHMLPQMVHLWRSGDADVVEAVKESRGRESLTNKVGARVFYTLISRLSGYNLEGASDFKLLDRRVVDAWQRLGERDVFFRGMTAWLGFRHAHLSFVVPERVGGRSRWSIIRLITLAVNAITSFSSKPLHLITAVGLVFMVLAALLGAQTLYLKLAGEAVSGFATVILLQLIIGSLLMISLGVIGLYLARIYEEVKGRPRYIIAQTLATPEADGPAPLEAREGWADLAPSTRHKARA
ncbi:MAG: glycosyltransferase family 2 protein [Anaerolineae bacterium]|nr:glycosyltransferase family 2 protein [Anaerolineae bacterium]